jgi:hypothetical protein
MPNIYSFLLAQGAPPAMISRIMDQLKSGQPLLENRKMGFRGLNQTPLSAKPQAPYSPLSVPRK